MAAERARAWLAPEGPINLVRDTLFREREEFWKRLQFVADHVAAAVASGTSHPAAVFGISAPWGSGKSSALQVTLDLIHERIGAHVPSLNRDQSGFLVDSDYVITTSTFRSNLHAGAPQPARLRLAYEILQAFPKPYWRQLLTDLDYTDQQIGAIRRLNAEVFLRSKLSEYLATGPAIEEWILDSFLRFREESQPKIGHLSHAHIEFVDDLDRCSETYTAEVLTALNYWTTLPNLFFIVAADEVHLRQSARAAGALSERYPGEALEKYVHYQLRVPPLIATYADAARYALSLIPVEEPLPPGVMHLRALLEQAKDSGPYGLMAPALKARTPRQAKRVFNELLQEFWVLRDYKGDSVKRIVARLAWPDEFEVLILPGILAGGLAGPLHQAPPRAAWLRLLLESAEQVMAQPLDEYSIPAVRLAEVAKARGLDLQGCPADLLLYLAAEPALQVPNQTSEQLSPPILGNVESITNPTLEGASETLRELTTKAEIARKLGRIDELVEHANEIVRRCASEPPESSDAPGIGNVALWTEMLNARLAWQLHQLAHAANPDHPNIRLNLADFLLDYGGPGAIPVIQEHLAWVSEHDPSYRAARQRYMGARLRMAMRQEPDNLELLVEEALSDEWYEYAERRELANILAAFKKFELLEEFSRRWVDIEEEKAEDPRRYSVLRLLGDKLFLGDREGRAADIHRFLLHQGYAPSDENFASSASNLAVYLYAFDFNESAGTLWRIAYEVDPQNANMRSLYARYLLDYKKDPEVAAAVQQGQEIPIPVLDDAELRGVFAELPAYFSEGDRWWESYPPGETYRRIAALAPSSA